LKTLELLEKNREKVYEIAKKQGVSNIRAFGSFARGEEKSRSDVDFLIKKERNISLFKILDFKYDLEKFLKRKVDLVLDDGINRHLKDIF
jgi:predicted nucleotidyltransferase